MREFDGNEHLLVVDDLGKGRIIARALRALLSTAELDGELEELDRGEVLEVERDVCEQLLMPQRHCGAE